jgi:hypothetical protein
MATQSGWISIGSLVAPAASVQGQSPLAATGLAPQVHVPAGPATAAHAVIMTAATAETVAVAAAVAAVALAAAVER